MKKFIAFCVDHPLLVNLLMLFCLAAGLISVSVMRREAFPNITYDMVTVRTDYFGAPAQEIEKLITIKIEDQLKEVDGIDEIRSVSAENVSMIVIQIDPDEKDKRKVVNDIQRAVDRVDDLPVNLEDDPIVEEITSKNFPVINVSLFGDLDEHTLREHARNLENRLLDISDVAKIVFIGWRDREIWVEVNPQYVNDYRLSLDDVVQALASQNLNLPGGNLDTRSEGEYLVRTIGEFETADEIKKVIIRANDAGNWVRVEDVAEVKDTFEDNDMTERTRGKKAVTLTVVKKESGDIIEMVQRVRETALEYQSQAGGDLQVSFFDDFSFYVKRRLDVLTNNGKIGIVLVLITLFLFLTRRVAVMTALGIPTALCAAFFIMYGMGMTINLITMFALIMVLGIIVDDSIVISENVYRHMEMGKPARQAAIEGTAEVAVPVISTVLTTVAAFAPLWFMSGILGKFIGAMPAVVIAALLGSLIECLTVLPSHLAEFGGVPRSLEAHRKKSRFDIGFQFVRMGYLKSLRWTLHHKYKALGVVGGVILLTAMLFQMGLVRYIQFPEGLIEEFYIRTKAAIETSVEENEKKMARIEEILEKLPASELDNYVTQIGLIREDVSDPYSERGSHLGQFHIYLTPENGRKRKADDIIADLRGKIKPEELGFEEITFEKVRGGPPVGKPISFELRGDNLDRLAEAAEKFKQHLSTITGALDIKDDYDKGKTELRVTVNNEEAAKAFLTVRDIANTVRSAIEGTVATAIQKTDEEIYVVVRYPEDYRKTKEIFNQLFVPNKYDRLIALSKVASLEEMPGIRAIKRLDRQRLVQVTGDVDERQVTPIEIQKKVENFYRQEIAGKYPDIAMSVGGEMEKTRESMADFGRAFILAIFLIFIVLACNFNSVLQPLVVMVSIPFGVIGVILAFLLHGQPLSFMAILGVIGLSGVVVNDSIVLVDFINRRRQEGHSRASSIFQAGRTRFRPVMLTSITTVAGLMPTAYGIWGSDPFVKPMALAIAWGLFFATALTLLIIPCIYSIFDELKQRTGRLVKKGWENFRGRITQKNLIE